MMCKSDYVLKIYLMIKWGKKFRLFLRLQTLQKDQIRKYKTTVRDWYSIDVDVYTQVRSGLTTRIKKNYRGEKGRDKAMM